MLFLILSNILWIKNKFGKIYRFNVVKIISFWEEYSFESFQDACLDIYAIIRSVPLEWKEGEGKVGGDEVRAIHKSGGRRGKSYSREWEAL